MEHVHGSQLDCGVSDQQDVHSEAQSSFEPNFEADDEQCHADSDEYDKTLSNIDLETSALSEATSSANASSSSVAQIEAHMFPFEDIHVSPISSIADSFFHVEWQ